MSLFDDILDEGSFTQAAFGPQEGFAGVLLAASACDGHIADEEANNLMLTLRQKKLYSRLTPQQMSAMFDRLTGVLRKGGPEKLLEKCYPVVPPELSETVFANAVDLVMANGSVDDDERQFINDLKSKLGLDDERSRMIVKVMVYKNHG
jgi:tellurite resistance protein